MDLLLRKQSIKQKRRVFCLDGDYDARQCAAPERGLLQRAATLSGDAENSSLTKSIPDEGRG